MSRNNAVPMHCGANVGPVRLLADRQTCIETPQLAGPPHSNPRGEPAMKLSYFVIPLAVALTACSSQQSQTNDHHDHGHKHPHHMKKDFQAMRERHFAMMDQDSDGQVSRTEYMQFHADHFQAMDHDNDGQLTLDDMKPPRK